MKLGGTFSLDRLTERRPALRLQLVCNAFARYRVGNQAVHSGDSAAIQRCAPYTMDAEIPKPGWATRNIGVAVFFVAPRIARSLQTTCVSAPVPVRKHLA